MVSVFVSACNQCVLYCKLLPVFSPVPLLVVLHVNQHYHIFFARPTKLAPATMLLPPVSPCSPLLPLSLFALFRSCRTYSHSFSSTFPAHTSGSPWPSLCTCYAHFTVINGWHICPSPASCDLRMFCARVYAYSFPSSPFSSHSPRLWTHSCSVPREHLLACRLSRNISDGRDLLGLTSVVYSLLPSLITPVPLFLYSPVSFPSQLASGAKGTGRDR